MLPTTVALVFQQVASIHNWTSLDSSEESLDRAEKCLTLDDFYDIDELDKLLDQVKESTRPQ